jgi:5-methylcytosine-specific restriction endonuclease McrA
LKRPCLKCGTPSETTYCNSCYLEKKEKKGYRKTKPRNPNYSTRRWQTLRAQAIARYGRRCAVADCPNDMTLSKMTHVDHVIEAEDGGDFWDINNLQVLCKPHHDAKSAAVRAGRKEKVSPNA